MLQFRLSVWHCLRQNVLTTYSDSKKCLNPPNSFVIIVFGHTSVQTNSRIAQFDCISLFVRTFMLRGQVIFFIFILLEKNFFCLPIRPERPNSFSHNSRTVITVHPSFRPCKPVADRPLAAGPAQRRITNENRKQHLDRAIYGDLAVPPTQAHVVKGYWQDSLRGSGIPTVISTSRLVPAASLSSCRLEPTVTAAFGPGRD